MSSVDRRVVEMQFNNERFERNARQTMSTLDKLKEKLSFRNATREMQDFQNEADSFNLSHIASVVDSIGDRFTMMGTLGRRAMERIADAAINAGSRIARSISVDQISAGMGKYTEETNAVQAIVAAVSRQGKTTEDVYNALGKLTDYSDATSYSYTQMTGALSMFIAAGNDMDQSETAIEGIANAAALAGVSIGDAAIAFRNFSDAMGKGYFDRTDWKSIQTIHMDTTQLREDFIETGKALGRLDSQGRITRDRFGRRLRNPVTVTAANLADSLQYGWLDTDVIMSTMMSYAYDPDNYDPNNAANRKALEAYNAAKLSRTFTDVMDTLKDVVSTGWKDTFRLIFGDIDEATQLFSGIADTVSEAIARVGEWRNAVLTQWRGLDGRDSMIGVLRNIWDTMTAISEVVRPAIGTIFGDSTLNAQVLGDRLWRFTEHIREITSGFAEWIRTSDRLRNTINLIADAINWVKTIGRGVWEFAKGIWNQLKPTFTAIWDFILQIGHDLFGLHGPIGDVEASLHSFTLLGLTDKFREFARIFEPITSRLPRIVTWVRNLYTRVKTFLTTNSRIRAMADAVKNVFNAFINFIPGAINSLESFGRNILNTIKNSDEWKWLKTNFERYVKPVGEFLWDFVVESKNAWADFFNMDTSDQNTLWDKIKKRFSAFDRLGPWFEQKWAELKERIPFLQEIEDWWNTSPFIREIREFFQTIGEAIDAFFSRDFGNSVDGNTSYLNADNSILSHIKKRWEAAWNILKPYFEQKWEQFKTWFQNKDWGEVFRNGLTAIGNALSSVFGTGSGTGGNSGWLSTKLGGVGQWISNFFNSIIDGIFTTSTNAESAAEREAEERATSATSSMGGENRSLWARIGDWVVAKFGKISDFLTTVKDGIGTQLSDAWNAVSTWIEQNGGTINTILNWFLTSELALTLRKVRGPMSALKKSIKRVGKSISGVFEAVEDRIQGKEKKGGRLKALALLIIAFAAAIWILVKAIEEINKMNETEFWEGAKRLGIIAGAMTIMLAIIGLTEKKGNASLGGALRPLLLAIAISKMVRLFFSVNDQLKDMNIGDIITTGVFILAIGAMLGLVLMLDGKYGKDAKSFRVLLSAIGVAILIRTFVDAVKQLSTIDPGIMTGVSLWIDAIVAMLALVLYADSKNQNNGQFRVLLSAVGIAVLIWMFGRTVKKLSTIPTGALLIATACVDSIVAILYILMRASKDMSTRGIVAMGIAMAGLILVIAAFSQAMVRVKDIDWEVMLAFSGGILILVGAMALMALAMEHFGKMNVAGAIKGALVMVIAAAAIGAAIAIIGAIVAGTIERFADVIAFVGASLAQYSDMINQVDQDAVNNSMTMLTNIAAHLVAIARYDYGNVETFYTSLSRVGAALVSYDAKIRRIQSTSEQLEAYAASAKRIAQTFSEIPDVQDRTAMLGQIGGAIKLYADSVAGVSFDENSGLDSSAIQRVFAALSGAVLGDENEQNLSEVATWASNEKGTELTLFAIGLENIATAVSSFSEAAKDLDFTHIEQAIAALTAISSLNTSLSTTAIAEFGPFTVTLSEQRESLDTFALDIISLGVALEAFGTSCGSLDIPKIDSGIVALGKLTDIQNALPREGGALQLLIGEKMSLSSLASNLRLLGNGVAAFSNSISTADFSDTAAIDAAIDIIRQISTISSTLPETGGLWGMIAGDESLANLATNLSSLGDGASLFMSKISSTTFENDKVTAAVDAIGIIANAYSVLPATGGLLGEIFGEASLGDFADNLETLADGAVKFMVKISGTTFDATKVEQATSAIGTIAGASAEIPSVGGLWNLVAGTQSLPYFSANLVLLGQGAKRFMETITGTDYDVSKVDLALRVIRKIVEANAILPETGGLVSWFAGEQSLSSFSDELGRLGEGITAFATSLSSSSEQMRNAESAANTLDKMSQVANRIAQNPTLRQYLSGDNQSEYVTAIARLTAAVVGAVIIVDERIPDSLVDPTAKLYAAYQLFASIADIFYSANVLDTDVDLIDFSRIENLGIYVSRAADAMNDIDPISRQTIIAVGEIVKGINDISSSLANLSTDQSNATSLSGYLRSFIDALTADEDLQTSYTGFGALLLGYISTGLTSDYERQIDPAISALTSHIDTRIRNCRNQMRNVGVYLMQGLADGIIANRYSPINAVTRVGILTTRQMQSVFSVHSPSRVFMEIGGYLDEGLAMGLLGSVSVVESAARQVGNSTMDAVLEDIRLLSEFPIEDMDLQPTIRPVLDTSGMGDGMDLISSLLNGNSIRINTAGLDLQAQMLNTDYTYDLASLSGQVEGINERLEKLGEAITHMQIVMNSGELVGAVESQIDRRMGERSRMGERGN